MTAPPLTRSRKGPRLAVVLVVVAVLASLAWLGLTIGNPFPRTTIRMVTGPEGSAYREFGLRYQEFFKGAGIDLRLIPTAGGFDNLSRLRAQRLFILKSHIALAREQLDKRVAAEATPPTTAGTTGLWRTRYERMAGLPRDLRDQHMGVAR